MLISPKVGICHLTWQVGLCRCIKLHSLTWGHDPGYPGGPTIVTWALSVEGDRRGQNDAAQEEFDLLLQTLRMEERSREPRNVGSP